MVAPRIQPRPTLLQPKLLHGISTSSLSSTHSRRSIIKNNVETAVPSRPYRRVRFTDLDQSMMSYQLEFFDESSSESYGSTTITTADVTVEVLEYDPGIDKDNAAQLFFTGPEIANMRSDARRQASRFAADYPDYVETLEQLYDQGSTDLEPMQKTLRTRRKRKHAMTIALKWSILDDDDDDDDASHEDDYCFDEDINEQEQPLKDSFYANQEESEEYGDVFCHADMRGLEFRMTPTFRMHRKQAIDAILQLQKDMKLAGCCPSQIEMGLRAKAVQCSSRTKQFAVNQALLDNMELVM